MKVIRFHALLALTLIAHAAISCAEELSAFFVDCEGQYMLVSAATGQIEAKGKVQDIEGAGMQSEVRDGCSVDGVRVVSTSTVILTVPNFMWESEDAKPPYFDLTLRLPELRLVKREPVHKRLQTKIAIQHRSWTRIQKAFLTGLGKGPFEKQTVVWSSNGRFAIVAERLAERDPRHSINVFARMLMGGDLVYTLISGVSGRFIAYDVHRNEEIGRYEISGPRMDLSRKTLMSPDGSFVFHCQSDVYGQRKLFLVRIAPKSSVTEIEYGELNPWLSAGMLVPSKGRRLGNR